MDKKCTRCFRTFDESGFHKHSSNKDGLHKWCKECACFNSVRNYRKNPGLWKERARSYRSRSPEIFLRSLWRSGAGGRRFPSSVEESFLIELYYSQAGKCHWSGEMMTFMCPSPRPNTNISVDRIDPARGYDNDNVVLCCSVVNQMRRDLTVGEFVFFCERICAHAGKI